MLSVYYLQIILQKAMVSPLFTRLAAFVHTFDRTSMPVTKVPVLLGYRFTLTSSSYCIVEKINDTLWPKINMKIIFMTWTWRDIAFKFHVLLIEVNVMLQFIIKLAAKQLYTCSQVTIFPFSFLFSASHSHYDRITNSLSFTTYSPCCERQFYTHVFFSQKNVISYFCF